MNKLDDARDFYNQIEIPEELHKMVEKTIGEHPKKKRTDKIRSFRPGRLAGYAAAAAAVCFTLALNTNEAFANGAGSIPFLGGIAKVLTVRSFETHDEDKNISVNVPAVEVAKETADEPMREENKLQLAEAQSFTGDINAEINKIVDDYVADAGKRFDEYKEAFFATGGTEEEWSGRDMDIDVDYEIKYQQGSVLSFVLTTTEAWCAVYGEQHYYNLDLSDSRQLKLADVLGADYVETANQAIVAQMKQRMEENPDWLYWGFEPEGEEHLVDGFTTVGEDTNFYINAAGNPVVCFPKYEVAPGFMGVQEFEIVK